MTTPQQRLAGLSPEKQALLRRRLAERTAPAAPIADAAAVLSFAQRRLWFLDQLEPGSTAYNIVEGIRLSGPQAFRLDVLHDCVRALVRRHDVLRTSFMVEAGEPRQRVAAELDPPFAVSDLRDLEPEAREAEALRITNREADTPFDLARGPLLRVHVIVLQPHELVFVLAVHHIVFDGWSRGVVLAELAELYRARLTGTPASLPPLPLQYADYARWQRAQLAGPRQAALLAYWRAQLAELPVLELPTDPTRASGGANASFRLPDALSAQLVAFARRHNVTMFMLLLAGFQALLARYAGQARFAVGTPIAGRTEPDLEPLIGFFVNTLVLSADVSDDPTFAAHLARVRETTLGAFAHQTMPFEQLVEELKPERRLGRAPLFQVMFSVKNLQAVRGGGGGEGEGITRGNEIHAERKTAQFELSLGMEDHHGWCGSFEYDTARFAPETIARMIRHFEAVLHAAVAAPDRRLSAMSLDDAEVAVIRRPGAVPAPLEIATHARPLDAIAATARCAQLDIAAHAARTPHAIAVVDGAAALSYRALDDRARRLAGALRARGVGPEVIVGVCLERSAELIVALVAVMYAGGAYLPLDPAHPADRLRFMLDDAKARVAIAGAELAPVLGDRAIVSPDASGVALDTLEADPAHLAYVIYTSGSTGAPKGVLIEHRALAGYLATVRDDFALTADDRVLQFTAPTFDVATEEIFGALTAGATLVLRDPALHTSLDAVLDACARHRLTVLDLPVAFWAYLVSELTARGLAFPAGVRLVIVGGEAVPLEAVTAWCALPGRPTLINAYGPTEATISATFWVVRPEDAAPVDRVPIGLPLPGVDAYLLDAQGRPVPAGLPGELYLGGPCLARGYLDRPALTAERFVANPFASPAGSGRLYRTGDLARRLPDGNLAFLGRTDHQVKLRGHRIELGEIEAALAAHPAVRDAVVLCLAPPHAPHELALIAFVVPQPGEAIDPLALRASLTQRLPGPMIPARITALAAWPVTSHGKIDRRALASLASSQSGTPEVSTRMAPRDELELTLARLWQKILGCPVGATDNFFALGGHSFHAIALMSAIEAELGRKLPVVALFQHQTLEALAAALREVAPDRAPSCLVPIQLAASGTPMFFVHPIGGNVLAYAELARQLARPIYGLQAHGFTADPDRSIPAMAARYTDAIRAIAPTGPYLLAGWSFGGAVAFEIARQLEAAGHEVGHVLALDSWAGWGTDAAPTDAQCVRWFLDDLAGQRHDLLAGITDPTVEARLAHGLDLARAAQLVPPGTDLASLTRRFAVFQANLDALRTHTPGAIRAPLTLFKARGNPRGAGDADHGWAGRSPALTVRDVPGDHYTLLQPLHAPALADAIRSSISAA